jgi:hypothetical protein
MGHPSFPLIDQGKDLGYTREKKRNRGERKTERKRALGLRCPSPLRAGPTGPADDNEGVRMSRPRPSLVLQTGAVVLFVASLSVTVAIGRRHCSTAAPRLTLARGMVNKSLCLESHGDRTAQCWSAGHCWGCRCLGTVGIYMGLAQ